MSEEPMLRQCPECLDWLPEDKFESNGAGKARKKRCSVCHYQMRLTKENGNFKARKSMEMRRYQYGITGEQYDALHEMQKGLCYICRHSPKNRALHVDHCHRTGTIRGLLCHRCNVALGFFKDDIDRLEDAIAYLLDPPFPRLVLNAPAEKTE